MVCHDKLMVTEFSNYVIIKKAVTTIFPQEKLPP